MRSVASPRFVAIATHNAYALVIVSCSDASQVFGLKPRIMTNYTVMTHHDRHSAGHAFHEPLRYIDAPFCGLGNTTHLATMQASHRMRAHDSRPQSEACRRCTPAITLTQRTLPPLLGVVDHHGSPYRRAFKQLFAA